MRTIYPDEPIRDYKEWREWISRQVIEANERRVIEEFKQSIIDARTKKK